MVSLASFTILPSAGVPFSKVVGADGVPPVIAGAVDSRVARMPIGIFVVAHQAVAALSEYERPPSVATQAALGEGLGVVTRLAGALVAIPVLFLAPAGAVESDVAAGAAL